MAVISEEKRALLIAAKKRGEKEEDIAKWLEISKGSVGTIWRLYRKTGDYRAKPYPGAKPKLSAEKWKEVGALIAKEPDKTLDEIIEELQLPIKKSRLSVLLIEAGYSFKKRQLIPPNKNGKTSNKNANSSSKS